jgi:amino acid transporter
MKIRDIIFGRPLPLSQKKKQQLTVLTGVPVLGLDSLASTGYGPEAALIVLMSLGTTGLHYYKIIVCLIVANLATLYFSYRQTAAAYPDGGGAYIVAKDNLNIRAGVWAATALLLDYLLNVCVAISAGISAVVSAVPVLQSHLLMLCLLVLATLTIVNLRGVKESGQVFVLPVLVFVGCIAVVIGIGLVRAWQSGGHPLPVVPPPAIPPPLRNVSAWVLLTAFANGCTAVTGIEAISNGVPLFRKPTVPRAQMTLTVVMIILSSFLLGLAYLCPAYHIGAMNEEQQGYQTVLSQLVGAVAGRGPFYYVSLASIFIVLTYSAQTSFAGFPRVCRLLAEDGFLPPIFAERGRRLVFSYGIIVLAALSALLLVVFGGVMEKLIPLFAVGAFSAFLLSQTGMVKHWLQRRGQGTGMKTDIKLFFNGLGAVATSIVLVIIIIAKFTAGAWMIILIAPSIVVLLQRIYRHYQHIGNKLDHPLRLHAQKLSHPVVIIPIDTWNSIAEKAVRFGLLLSNDVTAVHVSTERDKNEKIQLEELWAEKVEKPAKAVNSAVPRLEIVRSPYRKIYQPILNFVTKTKKEKPGRLVAVLIPELVNPRWWEYLLHNLYGAGLKTLLYLEGDERTIVISIPWHLRKL